MSIPTPGTRITPRLQPPVAPDLPPMVGLELSKVSVIENALTHERYESDQVLDKVVEGVARDLQARASKSTTPARN